MTIVTITSKVITTEPFWRLPIDYKIHIDSLVKVNMVDEQLKFKIVR